MIKLAIIHYYKTWNAIRTVVLQLVTKDRWLIHSSFLISSTHCVLCKHLKHEQDQGLQGSLTWAESGARVTAAGLFTRCVRDLRLIYRPNALCQQHRGLLIASQSRSAGSQIDQNCRSLRFSVYCGCKTQSSLIHNVGFVRNLTSVLEKCQKWSFLTRFFSTHMFYICGWCRRRGSCMICYY